MPRFFVSPDAIRDNIIMIEGNDAFHIARSLRMAVGDSVTVSDGTRTDYECRLTRIRDEACECEIVKRVDALGESPVEITLYMAYPKGDKLETVIQKAVELGAVEIVPFESSRCIKRPKAEKQEKVTARLQKIAEEAAKQCGRSRLAAVRAPMSYEEMLSSLKGHELALLCYEDETAQSIKDVLRKESGVKRIAVIVGSEGGFSPKEADAARAIGARSVTLGHRILRCETAPLYALAAISYEYEL
jgi:16S rRNA (uracil1498-N3)-methyltransferase